MKISKLFLAVAFVFALTPSAWAIDEGQTQPKITYAVINSPNSTLNIVNQSGISGNVKGLQCVFHAPISIQAKFFLDGGAAQTLNLEWVFFPVDNNGAYFTGFIPYNLRFESSLQVQLVRGASPSTLGNVSCTLSWALD